MKHYGGLFMILTLFALSSCSLFQKKGKVDEEFALNDAVDSVSYALSSSIAGNLKTQGVDSISEEAFLKGLQHAMSDDSLFLTAQQSNAYLREYFNTMQERKAKEAKEKAAAFFDELKENEAIKFTESGLHYEILEEGEGKKPKASDKVKVHYHGTLTNGEVFDSSVERGVPSEFGLNRVIKGWTEGLQLMKEGSKFKFYIPSELGYGERGSGQSIGSNEILIFEVELIEVL